MNVIQADICAAVIEEIGNENIIDLSEISIEESNDNLNIIMNALQNQGNKI